MSDEIGCAFSGRLTADPVPRTSKVGKAWLPLNLAVGSDDAVQFVSVALFGNSVPEMASRDAARLVTGIVPREVKLDERSPLTGSTSQLEKALTLESVDCIHRQIRTVHREQERTT